MAFVIVDGTGTYSAEGVTFKPGATRCDDQAILDAVSRERLDWVYVQSDRSALKVEPPKSEPVEAPDEPYDTWKGRDGKWYFTTPAGESGGAKQSEPYDEELIAKAAAELAQEEAGKVPLATDLEHGPQTGELTKDEAEATEFECKEAGCDKVFTDSGARENHERIQKHGAHRPPEGAPER